MKWGKYKLSLNESTSYHKIESIDKSLTVLLCCCRVVEKGEPPRGRDGRGWGEEGGGGGGGGNSFCSALPTTWSRDVPHTASGKGNAASAHGPAPVRFRGGGCCIVPTPWTHAPPGPWCAVITVTHDPQFHVTTPTARCQPPSWSTQLPISSRCVCVCISIYLSIYLIYIYTYAPDPHQGTCVAPLTIA